MSLESNIQVTTSTVKNKTARKSCLKRSSFEIPKDEIKGSSKQPPRRSKFDMLPKNGIDGIVIKNKRKSAEVEGQK